jgi:hypothetical protein
MHRKVVTLKLESQKEPAGRIFAAFFPITTFFLRPEKIEKPPCTGAPSEISMRDFLCRLFEATAGIIPRSALCGMRPGIFFRSGRPGDEDLRSWHSPPLSAFVRGNPGQIIILINLY